MINCPKAQAILDGYAELETMYGPGTSMRKFESARKQLKAKILKYNADTNSSVRLAQPFVVGRKCVLKGLR